MSFEHQKEYEALIRLLEIARRDTGQSRRVADFLLAWYNAEENGGWDPVNLWRVDTAIANDILTVLRLIAVRTVIPMTMASRKKSKRSGSSGEAQP